MRKKKKVRPRYEHNRNQKHRWAVLIVLDPIRHQLLEHRRHVGRLREVLEPLMGFRWDRSLICAAWADKFNDLLSIIKSSVLPPMRKSIR